jgi:1-acyl-sn-glycerol-3-phosphate acyltransferase
LKLVSILHSLFVWSASLTLGFGLMLPVGLLGLPFARDSHRYAHAWLRLWARCMMLFCWLDVEVEDPDRLRELIARRPLLLAVNHQSMMDIFVLLAVIPGDFAFLAKQGIFRIPLVGLAMRLSGYIPLRRDSARGISEGLLGVERALASGRSVVMFPEGTRSPDGRLGELKRGTALLAARSGAPILPLALWGTGRVLRKGAMFGQRNPVRLRAGDLIQVPPGGDEIASAHTLQLRDALSEGLESIDRRMGGSAPLV